MKTHNDKKEYHLKKAYVVKLDLQSSTDFLFITAFPAITPEKSEY